MRIYLPKRLHKALGTGLFALSLSTGLVSSPALAAQEAEAPKPPSAESILNNLTSVSPLNLVYVVAEEWKAGNKLRASFWYYVWQIRTDAWVKGMDDSGFKQLRAIISDEMGQAVNGWIAADPALMRDTATRAMGYEAKLPLWSERPEGMSQADWDALIAKTRADYAQEMRDAFADTTDEEILAGRQSRGLPVGTPSDQGAALPDDWR